jgi:serine/threonine protein kinase
MGEVWVADQLEPIKRRVALKLIKPGMDSRSVLGRFEAERQALAVMDHPNIAKVLDAGQTADGRPYFVMELAKGVPITEFADARRLTPQQRQELFVPVCQAIQHAHMKGIIHRDIKPSAVSRRRAGTGDATQPGVSTLQGIPEERCRDLGDWIVRAFRFLLGCDVTRVSVDCKKGRTGST